VTVKGGEDSTRYALCLKKYTFSQDDQVMMGNIQGGRILYLLIYGYFFNPQKNLKGVQILFLQKSMN